MKKVLVYDSGVGGINVLLKLRSRYPFFDFYYMSDGKNVPYGVKSKNELFEIVTRNLETVGVRSFDAVVLACNTMSTNLLEELSMRFFETSFFGIFPNIYLAEKFSTLLCCTMGTAKSPFVVAAQKKFPNLEICVPKGLVECIEKNIFEPEKIDLKNFVMSDKNFADKKFGAVLLGCTHFCYLSKQFSGLFPNAVIDGGILMKFEKSLGYSPTFLHKTPSDEKTGKIFFIFQDEMRNFNILKNLEK